MYNKMRLFLLYFISICVLISCGDNGYVEQKNTTQNLNPVLFKELDSLLSIGEHLADNRWCFVLKFFKIDTSLYFSLWIQPYFPTIIPSQTGFLVVDTNNMFGFNIANYNIIIIDYPESDGYGLYAKNQLSNKKAMFFKKLYEENLSCPIISDRKPSYITYMIKDGKLIRRKPIIPPKHKTDKPFEFEIIPDKDEDFFKFLIE